MNARPTMKNWITIGLKRLFIIGSATLHKCWELEAAGIRVQEKLWIMLR